MALMTALMLTTMAHRDNVGGGNPSHKQIPPTIQFDFPSYYSNVIKKQKYYITSISTIVGN
jgi:hypothetical protein